MLCKDWKKQKYCSSPVLALSCVTLPPAANCTLETLAISFKEEAGGYLHTDAVQGAKSFALWPLSQAAQSCFGHESWPTNLPVPQAWLEFDVENVATATAELEAQGHHMLIRNKAEPWGQTVSRFMDPDGILVGLTFTPWMREKMREKQ